MKRLCIFAHFDRDNEVDDYVFFYLSALKKITSHIIFVSSSRLGEQGIERLRTLCDSVILKDNVGYDFGSWQCGLGSVEDKDEYDEIIICNDSVYGPLCPLEGVFEEMDRRDCDFWGLTESHDIGKSLHIQSYFLVFRKRTITSGAFRDFWGFPITETNKDMIIKKYEVGLSQSLTSEGLKPCVYSNLPKVTRGEFLRMKAVSFMSKSFKEKVRKVIFWKWGRLDRRVINPTHYFWKDLIVSRRMPFLKIELLRDNPISIDIRNYEDVIQKHTDYDVGMIRKHLERMRK